MDTAPTTVMAMPRLHDTMKVRINRFLLDWIQESPTPLLPPTEGDALSDGGEMALLRARAPAPGAAHANTLVQHNVTANISS